tara:strand:- start:751 stop:1518 length:768 start_codon:yes stop_codon:yes gene_type:complete
MASISILCAVKDRTEHLLQSYKTWLDCDCVDEVVIVDWGSKEPISEKLEHHKKLKLVQINPDHTKYWSFSQAYNTAARFASCDYYLIMNADEIMVSTKELCSLEPPSNFFYEGTSWDSPKAHGVYFLYLSKEAFWKVNGYHEQMIGYGYDDVDLRRRLEKAEFSIKKSSVKIEHIKHGADYRTRDNMMNYVVSWSYPWGAHERLIDLDYKSKNNIIYCDIGLRDRITYEKMLDREGVARVYSGAASWGYDEHFGV